MLSWGAAACAQYYALADIGGLGGDYAVANGTNAAGQVAGAASTAAGTQHAFLYCNGPMDDIGTLGGSSSVAKSVNDAGLVVGAASTAGDASTHAFLYGNGSMQDLGDLGGSYSAATAVNDAGQVVGMAAIANGSYHAFQYAHGSMRDLGTLGGTLSVANSINGLGQSVGFSSTGDAASAIHATLFSGAGPQDLGTLGGAYSAAAAINSFGEIAGISLTAAGNYHAFVYGDGLMQDIGTLGGGYSSALGINVFRQMVGTSSTADGGDLHAFLYDNGLMQDLNALTSGSLAPFVTLTAARAIGDDGTIVASGIDVLTGQMRAYLLTPTALFRGLPPADCTALTPPTSLATVGAEYEFAPAAGAPTTGGDGLTFSVANKPSWATFDSTTGELSGTPGPQDAGSYANVVVSVSNGVSTAALATFSIYVAAPGGGSVTLSWVAPTRNTDGSALTDLAGYVIHYGSAPTALNQSLNVSDPTATGYTLGNLSPGTYYFAVTDYAVSGASSDLSGLVSKTL
jgi:probable HAF family extracellular repeat protein